MKRNQHQVTSKSSRPAARSQPKTKASSAKPRPVIRPGCLALFAPGDDVSMADGVVTLKKTEYAALKRAFGDDSSILWFMAKAALEKAFELISSPVPPAPQKPLEAIERNRIQRLSDTLLDAVGHDRALRRDAGIVTCVWTGPDGREQFRTEFNRAEFARIERAVSKLGITLQQFFDDAIWHYIDSHGNRRAA